MTCRHCQRVITHRLSRRLRYCSGTCRRQAYYARYGDLKNHAAKLRRCGVAV